jgi:hypothetical protein
VCVEDGWVARNECVCVWRGLTGERGRVVGDDEVWYCL